MKIDENLPRESSLEETFFMLDRQGQTKILHCLEEIAGAFSLNKNSTISTDTVASPLVSLERNISHQSIPSLLASMGIKAEEGMLSLTGSMSEITTSLRRMKDIISTTPNVKPQPSCRTINRFTCEEEVYKSLGIQKPNIDQILGPVN